MSSDRGAATVGDENASVQPRVDLVERHEVALDPLSGNVYRDIDRLWPTEVSGMGTPQRHTHDLDP